MPTASQDKLTECSSNSAKCSSQKDIVDETASQPPAVTEASEVAEKSSDTKTELSGNDSTTEKRRSITECSSNSAKCSSQKDIIDETKSQPPAASEASEIAEKSSDIKTELPGNDSTTEKRRSVTECSSNSAKCSSQKDIIDETKSQPPAVSEASEIAEKSSEAKTELPGNDAATEQSQSLHHTPSLGRQSSHSSHPSLAQDLQVQQQVSPATDNASAPTASESQGKNLPSKASVARVTSSVRESAVRVSKSGAASATAISPGLTSRISSLSAAAGASLRGLIANSSVVKGNLGSVTSEGGGGGGGGGSNARQTGTGTPPTGGAEASADPTEPSTQTVAEGAEVSGSADDAVKEEPIVKQEPPDSAETTPSAAAAEVPDASLKAHQSEAFTPSTAPFSPETERPESLPSAATAPAPGPSAPSSHSVKMVKAEASPSGRRSSSYLYNDWDRTLYEKTGRPPPGEAHWSRENSAHKGSSSTRRSGADTCPHSRTSGKPKRTARSTSTRRQRSRSRPAISPNRRRPFDMTRCQRDTYDQFGRRIVFHNCFIEPEFTLFGQGITVQGARKGSISAAEDTYAGYALEVVTPPSESQLSAQKVQRRTRGKKKRHRRRRREHSPRRKSVKGERALMEEQWQRLEEESEKLEEDKMRLQETRQHLEQLEEWWETEGLLILQRDELRAQEEQIINAVIEEECLRINEEKARIRQEWQFLLERMALQDKEETRINEDINALGEKQEEVAQREETDERRMHEMKAVFEIERRMMEADRKQLVIDALKSDTFRDALEDRELAGWASLAEGTRSGTCARSASVGEPTQSEIDDLFANLKDSSLERLLADKTIPPVSPEPEQRSPAPASPEPEQRPPAPAGDSDSEPPRQRPARPITARGRPVRASRSTPSGDAMAQQTVRPLNTVRSEGDGPMATPADTPGGGGGETIDVWRRRLTMMQRGDRSSVAEEESPDGDGAGSSTHAPSVVMSDEPAKGGSLRAFPAGERVYARSEGYIDPDAKRATAKSERRRASAMPGLETQEKPGQVSPVDKPNTDVSNVIRQVTSRVDDTTENTAADEVASQAAARASESVDTGSTPAKAAPPAQPETLASTPPASSETGEPTADNGTATAVSEPDSDVVGSASSADDQVSSRRSSLRSGDATPRHVSFHEQATVQTLNDGADGGEAGERVEGGDGGDDAGGRRRSTAPADGGIEVKEGE